MRRSAEPSSTPSHSAHRRFAIYSFLNIYYRSLEAADLTMFVERQKILYSLNSLACVPEK